MTKKKQNDKQLAYIRFTGMGSDVFGISVPDLITITLRDWEELFGDIELIFAGPKRIILYLGKSSLFDKDLREFFATKNFRNQSEKMVVVVQDDFQEVLMHAAAHEGIASGNILITYNEREAEKIILK